MSTDYSEYIGPDKRKEEILNILKDRGRVRVAELSREFDISEVTIRTDLAELESRGLLKRTRGGAIGTQKAYFNMSLAERMEVNKEEKKRIAGTASGLVAEGETLMIDSGATNYYVAKELAGKKNITVVTNSLMIAQEMSFSSLVNVILLGGSLDPQHQFTFGADTAAQLVRYKADKAIISTDGVSVEPGLTTFHHREADVSRKMIERSNNVIAVADHSKIGKEGFAFIARLDKIDYLITDKNIGTNAELNKIRRENIIIKQV